MSQRVPLTVDGRSISLPAGENLLQAFRSAGIPVPGLCYHPRLTPNEACRLCMVKVDGRRGLTPACTLRVEEGMQVIAFDEELEGHRKALLDLLLSEHNCDCLACESAGSCELQDLAYRYGLDVRTRTGSPSPEDLPPLDVSSPVLVYDRGKCIVCSRCIGACDEIQGKGVLGYAFRGPAIAVTAGLGEIGSSECDGCGECVQVCPTGAMRERLPSRPPRRWEAKLVQTTCSYCGVGCQLELWTDGRRVSKVRGAEGPPNHGSLCVKGRFGFTYSHREDRLIHPLIRRQGELHKASWEEALSLVAEKLAEIRECHGPDAIAGLSSAKCTNEENYLFQKLMRAALGTNNVDHCARLCHASTVAGLGAAFGSGAMTNSIEDLEEAECILVTGSNTTETHPVIGAAIKRAVRRGAKLIVIDPRKIDLVGHADLWLRQRGGTDVAWANGLMNVMLREGLHDEAFIAERTEGFEELKSVLDGYTPERVESITGIPAQKLVQAARLYASAPQAAIVYSMGVTQHSTGTNNVLSLANLAMLAGNVGRWGAGVNPLRGQNNVQGACDLGALPNVFPGYQKVSDPAVREKFSRAWGASLAGDPGLTVVEMMHAAQRGEVRGMLIMGENPMLSDPNLNQVEQALEELEFLAVQDIFLTETARLADVVLPAASYAEKEGTFTNTERRVLRVRKAVEAPGKAKPDWEILCALAGRLGYPMEYTGPADVMEEMASLTPIYGGMSYDRLEGEGLQWPCPSPDHPGTRFLHEGKFTRGRARFHAVEYLPSAESPDEEYPFLLSTGRMLYHYHTGSLSRRVDALNEFAPEAYVEINPADADALGIADGDRVRVATRRGEIVSCAKLSDRVARGSLFAPFHFAEAAANRLTNDVLDPTAKIPELKVAACRLAKA